MDGTRTWACSLLLLLCLPAWLPAQTAEETNDKKMDQAVALFNKGKVKEAARELSELLPQVERTSGKSSLMAASVLGWLASAHYELGEYAKAEPLYRRSLEIGEAKLGKDHPDVASLLQNLAGLYRSMGQYAKAEPLFRRSLGINEAKLGKDHLDVATSLHNLAGLYESMGQYAKAEPLFRRSLAINEAKLDKDHPDVASSLHGLAGLYRSMGEYAKAEPLYRRSLAINEAKLGKDHLDVASSLHSLALLYWTMAQYAKAEPLYRRSLEIKEAKLGKDHPSVASSLNNLAALYHSMGEFAKAEPLFRRSLEIWEARLDKDHPSVAKSLNNLAILLAEQDRTKEASELIHRARQSSRQHIGHVLPSLPQPEQAAFLSVSERRDLARALSLGLILAEAAGQRARSAEWLLNGKALGQEALAQSALLARDSMDPATQTLAEQLRQTRSQLARLSLAVAPTGKEKEHRDRIEELNSQERDLARRLAAAGGSSSLVADWVPLDSVRRLLPAGGVLIDVVRFDVFDFKGAVGKKWKPARYVAWLTFARGEVQIIDLGDADRIDAAVKAVRQELESSQKLIRAKGEAQAEKSLREPLQALSKLVLEPLLPHVGKSKNWIVSPDGNLWLIPWEVLLLKDGKYAVENHAIRYVLSGRDLLPQTPYKGKVRRPLIMADPDFDLDAQSAVAEITRLLGERQEEESLRSLSGAFRLGDVKRLPGTLREAKTIEKRVADYTKMEPRVLTGKSALESVVKYLRNPRVLVLSTHGFFLPDQQSKPAERRDERAGPPPGWENPLLRCGLLLAGCNEREKTGSDDGVLTGLEVVGLDLRGCEMVVLSACETGIGDVQNGEGVAGLRQAFLLAGAESVVSTLWKVPDESSARLMSLFFANLAKGKDRATALREAQLKLIEDRRDDSAAAHPFFWAAFTFTGR